MRRGALFQEGPHHKASLLQDMLAEKERGEGMRVLFIDCGSDGQALQFQGILRPVGQRMRHLRWIMGATSLWWLLAAGICRSMLPVQRCDHRCACQDIQENAILRRVLSLYFRRCRRKRSAPQVLLLQHSVRYFNYC